MGLESVISFRSEFAPLLVVEWVGRDLHESGLDHLATRGKRALSLTDAVSFMLMRREGIGTVYSFDRHFEDEGFVMVS